MEHTALFTDHWQCFGGSYTHSYSSVLNRATNIRKQQNCFYWQHLKIAGYNPVSKLKSQWSNEQKHSTQTCLVVYMPEPNKIITPYQHREDKYLRKEKQQLRMCRFNRLSHYSETLEGKKKNFLLQRERFQKAPWKTITLLLFSVMLWTSCHCSFRETES